MRIKERYIIEKEGEVIEDFYPYTLDGYKEMDNFITHDRNYSSGYNGFNKKWYYNMEYELINENKKDSFFRKLKEDGWKIFKK